MGKRLAILSDNWYPIEGGAEQQVRRVAQELQQRGWDVRVVARALPDQLREPGDAKLHIERVSSRNGQLGKFELASRVALQIQRMNPDAAIGSLVSAVSLGGLMAMRGLSRPYVLRVGGATLSRFHKSAPLRVVGRRIVDSCSRIVINARHLRTEVENLHPRKAAHITLIRNGVPGASGGLATPRHGRLRALYYTNGGILKNDSDFLAIVRASPDIEFCAVGNIDSLSVYPNLVRLGWVRDLPPLFSESDVVLNTSISEGSPNFCMQALAAGKPVLGFDNLGLREMATDWPDAVRVVPMRDVTAFVEALRGQPWRSKSIHVDIPTISQAADQWEELLLQLIRW